ncbi:MAG TPA: hypothetical protein VK573_03050 [Gemmatimonadales bacterium]|nr:hypothetical protein [Gemmatimonadales bacterium]
MAAVAVVGPVVRPRPFAQGSRQLRGRWGPGVDRIYKRVNNFTIVKGCGPPCDEVWGEAYRHS